MKKMREIIVRIEWEDLGAFDFSVFLELVDLMPVKAAAMSVSLMSSGMYLPDVLFVILIPFV